MKTIITLIAVFIYSFFSYPSFAQNNTPVKYIKVINNIDSLINITFKEIKNDLEKSKNIQATASSTVKTLNKTNSETLNTKLIPELEVSLVNDFGTNYNISNQIYPFIVSLKECTEALENLTTGQFYNKDDFNDYTNAFLFKELAKGNLFRTLSNMNTDRNKFSVSLSYGGLFQNLENKIKTSLIDSKNMSYSVITFYNQNQTFNKAFFNMCAEYLVSKRVLVGFSFRNLQSTGANGKIILNDSTIDYIKEVISGNTLSFSTQYILKQLKPSGYGFEAKCGLGIDYNLYKLITDFQINQLVVFIDSNQGSVSFYEISTNSQTESLSSLGFNFNATINYFFNKKVSLRLGLTQYFDFGVNVPSKSFDKRNIDEHTLKCNAFAFDIGLAAHF